MRQKAFEAVIFVFSRDLDFLCQVFDPRYARNASNAFCLASREDSCSPHIYYFSVAVRNRGAYTGGMRTRVLPRKLMIRNWSWEQRKKTGPLFLLYYAFIYKNQIEIYTYKNLYILNICTKYIYTNSLGYVHRCWSNFQLSVKLYIYANKPQNRLHLFIHSCLIIAWSTESTGFLWIIKILQSYFWFPYENFNVTIL